MERYLRSCLESAINQTLMDIEIMCVNDASPDGSGAILGDYAKKDSRIKVIEHIENRKLFFARQTGIAAAMGEYLFFLDGDDSIAPQTCEKLYEKARKTEAEIVCFGGYRFNDAGEKFRWGEVFNRRFKGSESFDFYLTSRLGHSLCNKLYRRDLLDRCDFSGFRNAFTNNEDALANLIIFAHSKRCIAVAKRYYYYRINEESSSQSSNYVAVFKDYALGHGAFLKQYIDQGIFRSHKEKISHFLYQNIHYILSKAMMTNGNEEAIYNYFKECPEIALYLSRRVNAFTAKGICKFAEMGLRKGVLETIRYLRRKTIGRLL